MKDYKESQLRALAFVGVTGFYPYAARSKTRQSIIDDIDWVDGRRSLKPEPKERVRHHPITRAHRLLKRWGFRWFEPSISSYEIAAVHKSMGWSAVITKEGDIYVYDQNMVLSVDIGVIAASATKDPVAAVGSLYDFNDAEMGSSSSKIAPMRHAERRRFIDDFADFVEPSSKRPRHDGHLTCPHCGRYMPHRHGIMSKHHWWAFGLLGRTECKGSGALALELDPSRAHATIKLIDEKLVAFEGSADVTSLEAGRRLIVDRLDKEWPEGHTDATNPTLVHDVDQRRRKMLLKAVKEEGFEVLAPLRDAYKKTS